MPKKESTLFADLDATEIPAEDYQSKKAHECKEKRTRAMPNHWACPVSLNQVAALPQQAQHYNCDVYEDQFQRLHGSSPFLPFVLVVLGHCCGK